MRFGIFYEHQLPRPWSQDSERRLLADALEQIELADRIGIDYAWEVEHHFLEEYSHSSAPEVFLAAASQRTKRIRLGHGVVQLPPAVNHPARVAERIATLDLISAGRVDFGTGESSSAAELAGFGVTRSRKREQWDDALDAVTRMFVEEPFAGWDSPWLQMPVRNVLPKPWQRPHPPLWVACSRRETIHLAARKGIGALSFSFAEPEEARTWVEEYYEILEGPECRPAGFAVNANVAVVLPMMCHHDEATALQRGIEGAQFFGFSLAHYYGMSPHAPGRTDLAQAFAAQRAASRHGATTPLGAPLALKVMQAGLGSLRGAIGTPDQVRELVERYEAAGVDQVIFVLQAGHNRHEHICESLDLFGREVLPGFAERREAAEAHKRERLAPAIASALARRPPPRTAPDGYRIDEAAELARRRVDAPPTAPGSPRPLPSRAAAAVGHAAERRAGALLARAVRESSDERLEQVLAHELVQRVLLELLARRFRPPAGRRFDTEIACELTAATQPSRMWTLRIQDGRATVLSGRAAPALTLRLPVARVARVAVGQVKLIQLLAGGQLGAQGDLSLLPRLTTMFGGPSPY